LAFYPPGRVKQCPLEDVIVGAACTLLPMAPRGVPARRTAKSLARTANARARAVPTRVGEAQSKVKYYLRPAHRGAEFAASD
jgi:hypothetical protein